MPNYNYLCKNLDCSYDFEVYQSIKDESLRDCPECSRASLDRVIHAVPALVLNKEPKTLGLLAEQNTQKLSRQAREAMWGQQAAQKEEIRKANRGT